MWTIEPRMVIIYEYSPISFEHVPFWYLFLEPYQSTYHSNIGVLIRKVTESGTSTLQDKIALIVFPRPLVFRTLTTLIMVNIVGHTIKLFPH